MQMTQINENCSCNMASWKTGKGKTLFDRRYPNLFWARNPMEASEWPHSFDLNSKRSIYNLLDESQKTAAREARPGTTREPFFAGRRGQFRTQKSNFDFNLSFHNWLPNNATHKHKTKAPIGWLRKADASILGNQ